MNINQIKYTLDGSIKRAAEKAIRGQPFRNRKLSVADTIRLLIGAEGGSLDKILHAAGIEVTASAVSQRRAQIDPAVFRAVFDSFNAACVDTEIFHGCNFLILDEPTNHLDIQAKESLKTALSEFPGTVLLVSHEELFYRDWAQKIINIEKR